MHFRSQKNSTLILTGNVKSTLFRLSAPLVPGILALLSLDFYDSYLASKLGVEALAALGFTMPVSNAMFALAIGFGICASVLVTNAAGSGQWRALKNIVSTNLFLSAVVSLLIGFVAFLLLNPTLTLIGISPEFNDGTFRSCPQIKQLIENFLGIRLLGLPFLVIPLISAAILRALGQVKESTALLIIWVMISALLDTLLISDHGLLGIAMGHLASDVFCSVLSIFFLLKRDKLITWPKNLRVQIHNFLSLSTQGSLIHFLFPVHTSLIVYASALSGPNSLAAITVSLRAEPLILIVAMTLSASLPAFIGQNWSAGNIDRLQKSARTIISAVVKSQLILAIILFLFAPYIAGVLSNDPDIQNITQHFLRIAPISYCALSICIIGTSIFTASGGADLALKLILIRVFLISAPCLLLGHLMDGIHGLIAAIAISNAISGGLYISILFKHINKTETPKPIINAEGKSI